MRKATSSRAPSGLPVTRPQVKYTHHEITCSTRAQLNGLPPVQSAVNSDECRPRSNSGVSVEAALNAGRYALRLRALSRRASGAQPLPRRGI
jgi:hypothetical protein